MSQQSVLAVQIGVLLADAVPLLTDPSPATRARVGCLLVAKAALLLLQHTSVHTRRQQPAGRHRALGRRRRHGPATRRAPRH